MSLPIAIVGALILATLALTAYAARRTSDTGDHYVAGQRISGWQNGLALAGDQISAASFLGITGAVALTGFGGFYLAVGIPTAYLLVLLVIAEPLRNLGRFTLADAVAARFDGRALRGAIAVATLVMSTIYMVVQFVGAGLIAGLLLDVDFGIAVVLLGALMTVYTLLGGMVATTYIQIFKTSLLAFMVLLVFAFVISRTGWNPLGPMQDAAGRFGNEVIVPDRSDDTVSLNNLSLNIGLTLGIMGLPHVMVRFLTVRDARAARSSALVAMGIFAVFFLMLPLFGYAALNEVGREQIVADNPAGNAAGPRLAEIVGGEVVFAIVAGVTITTILAVLAGLAIAASGAVAHDLYTNVIKRGDVTPERQLWVGRAVGIGIAAVAIALALGAPNLNIAFLANVAFAIAASTTMPVLLLTIYWRGFNRTGATAGMIGGLTVALVLVLLGPDVLGEDDAIFPLSIPAIVSVPAGFLCAFVGSLAGRGRVHATGMPYDEFVQRAFPARGARFTRDGDPAARAPARPGDPTPSSPGAGGNRAGAAR
jgi:SSS family solute:Na+ symporter/cation/acetate symporter